MFAMDELSTIFHALERKLLLSSSPGRGEPEEAAKRAATEIVKLLSRPENAQLLQQPFSSHVASSSSSTGSSGETDSASTPAAAAAVQQLVQECLKHDMAFEKAFMDAMFGRQDPNYYAYFADLGLAGKLAELAVWLQKSPDTLWATQQQQQQQPKTAGSGKPSSGKPSSGKKAGSRPLIGDEYVHKEAVQLWWLCQRSLQQIFLDLFMAEGRVGNANVRKFTRQLIDAGWVSAAASTLSRLQDNQPPLWIECSSITTLLFADVMHSWTSDRRADTPVQILQTLPDILQQSQRCLDYLIVRAAAAAAAGPGSSRGTSAKAKKGFSQEYQRVLTHAEKRLLRNLLQIQVYVIEVGVMISATNGKSNKIVTDLATSADYAAAAGQLLAAACHQMYLNQQHQQQRDKKNVAAAEEDAGGSSSSGGRQCLVPTKKLPASSLNISPVHLSYPLGQQQQEQSQQTQQQQQQQHADLLRNVLLNVINSQHPFYGECECEDMILMAQMGLHQHITEISGPLLSAASSSSSSSDSSSSSSSSPALSAAAVQVALEVCLLTAAAAEKEQQERRFRPRRSDWEYSPMQSPHPCIPYKNLLEQSFQLLHLQLTVADNNTRNKITVQSAYEILSLLTYMAQLQKASSFANYTPDLSYMMFTGPFLLGTVFATCWDRLPPTAASSSSSSSSGSSSAELAFFEWQLQQRFAAYKALDPEWGAEDDKHTPLNDFGRRAELAGFVIDSPQPMLQQLAASEPLLYFSFIDTAIRKDTSVSHTVLAAQLIRQGCWGVLGCPANPKPAGVGFNTVGTLNPNSSTQNPSDGVNPGPGVGEQNPKPLLLNPAGVLALGSAVASLVKVWVVGYNKQHATAAATAAAARKQGGDFCLGVAQRQIRVGLLEVAEPLLLALQQQQQQGSEGASSVGPTTTSSGGNNSRQVAASSLFLLLVLARSAAVISEALAAAGQGSSAAADGEATAKLKRSADPKVVWRYCQGLLEQINRKCVEVLAAVQQVLSAPTTTAAAGSTHGSGSGRAGSTHDVAGFNNLLQIWGWYQQKGDPVRVTQEAADGEDVSRALKELLDKIPVPELCSSVICSNTTGISEVAAARKRCGGCQIARYCSVECQQQHWQQHKAACGQVKAARAAGLKF